MEKVFATPKEGVLVRHENGKPLDVVQSQVELTLERLGQPAQGAGRHCP